MPEAELRTGGSLAYREALAEPATRHPVVLVHGFPESSLMWTRLMARLSSEGRDCVAPDLYSLGDSPAKEEVTFEGTLADFTELMDGRDGTHVVVVHDWGGFIGLAWACEHPERVAALVLANTGFFHDGRWHGMAEALRSEQGEAVLDALDGTGFAGMLRAGGDTFSDEEIAAYWRPFEDGRGRPATLGFYRSMDFEKLEPYDGKLAALGVPTLILWGADDQFAPLSGARRFEREIPGARLIALGGVGHFVFDEAPDRAVEEVAAFLDG